MDDIAGGGDNFCRPASPLRATRSVRRTGQRLCQSGRRRPARLPTYSGRGYDGLPEVTHSVSERRRAYTLCRGVCRACLATEPRSEVYVAWLGGQPRIELQGRLRAQVHSIVVVVGYALLRVLPLGDLHDDPLFRERCLDVLRDIPMVAGELREVAEGPAVSLTGARRAAASHPALLARGV